MYQLNSVLHTHTNIDVSIEFTNNVRCTKSMANTLCELRTWQHCRTPHITSIRVDHWISFTRFSIHFYFHDSQILPEMRTQSKCHNKIAKKTSGKWKNWIRQKHIYILHILYIPTNVRLIIEFLVAELKKSTRHRYTPPSVSCTFFICRRAFLLLLSSMAKNRRSPKSFAMAECAPNFTLRSRESILLTGRWDACAASSMVHVAKSVCQPAGQREKDKIRREKEKENAKWRKENKTQMIDLCCHRRIHRLMVAQVFCTHISVPRTIHCCIGMTWRAHRWRWQQAMNHLTSFYLHYPPFDRSKRWSKRSAEKVNTWNRMDVESSGKSSEKKFTK